MRRKLLEGLLTIPAGLAYRAGLVICTGHVPKMWVSHDVMLRAPALLVSHALSFQPAGIH